MRFVLLVSLTTRVQTLNAHSNGCVNDLDPEFTSDMLSTPGGQLVPVVQAIAVLEYGLDIEHSQEPLSILVSIVYRHV